MTVLLGNSFVTSVPTAGTSFITLFITVFPQIRLSRSPSPSIHLSSVLVKDTVPFMERGLSPRIPHRRAAQHLIVLLENLHFTLLLPADPYGFSEQQTTFLSGSCSLIRKMPVYLLYLVKIVPSQPSSHSNGSFKL